LLEIDQESTKKKPPDKLRAEFGGNQGIILLL